MSEHTPGARRYPQEWARIVDTRAGGEVCRIAIDDACRPTEWQRRHHERMKGIYR